METLEPVGGVIAPRLIQILVPKKYKKGKGLTETKEERVVRRENNPISRHLSNIASMCEVCEFPNPMFVLSRQAILRHRLVEKTAFTSTSADSRVQRLAVVEVDDCPFEHVKDNIGEMEEVLRHGTLFSYREVSALLKGNIFQTPTFVPIVTHKAFKNMKLAVIKVFDKNGRRRIRLGFEDEISDVFTGGGDMILRPM